MSETSAVINNHSIRSLQQTHQGIPIFGYQSRLVLDEQGNQVELLGQHQGFTDDLSTETALSFEQAVAASALTETSFSNEEPIYFVDEGEPRLSWEVIGANSSEGRPSFEKLYIDAVSGEVIARYPMIHSALSREVGDMGKACSDMGINYSLSRDDAWEIELMVEEEEYHRSEGEASEGVGYVDDLYMLFADAYTFLESMFGMDSLDDNGMRLKGIAGVHYDGDYGFYNNCSGNEFNAGWHPVYNEIYMTEDAIDYVEVLVHEIGHGVVSNGSGLEGGFDSGALNEAIGDALGVTFRAWQEAGGASLGSNPSFIPTFPSLWELRGPGFVLRNMRNPKSADSDMPDHYNDYYDLPYEVDDGGVHINNNIINQAFYLLVEGGQHPRLGSGPNVQGIGIVDASRVWTEAARNLLTPTSDFLDARNAFAMAAQLLYGEYSDNWVAVHEALDAVGLPGTWQRGAPTPPPVITPTPIPQPDPEPTPAPTQTPVPVPTSTPEPAEPAPGPVSTPMPDDVTPAIEAANNNALYIGLGLAFVLLAIFGLSKLRPDYSTAGPEFRRAATTPPPMPLAEPEPGVSQQQVSVNRSRIAGRLVGSGTSSSIEMEEALLSSKEGLVIGRSANLNHVVLNDSRVSRRHCRIRKEGHIAVLEDLNSTHGTVVNGSKLQPFSKTVVKQGDSIEIAGINFICDLTT